MKKWVFWLVAVAVLAGMQAGLRGLIGAYNYQILILVGINIILAVSLNLINGVYGSVFDWSCGILCRRCLYLRLGCVLRRCLDSGSDRFSARDRTVLPLRPMTFFEANAWTLPVTLSPGLRPLTDGMPAEVVVPSYVLLSVTALMSRAAGVIVPVVTGTNVIE